MMFRYLSGDLLRRLFLEWLTLKNLVHVDQAYLTAVKEHRDEYMENFRDLELMYTGFPLDFIHDGVDHRHQLVKAIAWCNHRNVTCTQWKINSFDMAMPTVVVPLLERSLVWKKNVEELQFVGAGEGGMMMPYFEGVEPYLQYFTTSLKALTLSNWFNNVKGQALWNVLVKMTIANLHLQKITFHNTWYLTGRVQYCASTLFTLSHLTSLHFHDCRVKLQTLCTSLDTMVQVFDDESVGSGSTAGVSSGGSGLTSFENLRISQASGLCYPSVKSLQMPLPAYYVMLVYCPQVDFETLSLDLYHTPAGVGAAGMKEVPNFVLEEIAVRIIAQQEDKSKMMKHLVIGGVQSVGRSL